MSKMLFRERKRRALTALLLLCAMLLSACGSLPPLPPLPGEAGDAPAVTAQSEETAATPAPTPEPFTTDVVLSELQASNKASVADADGAFSDWIELYNPGSESCEISRCYLSDDEADLCKWQIPSLTLASGEYRVVFCSGKNRTEGELHTNFKLSGSGDTLYFSSPEGQLLWSADYDSCAADAVLRFEGESVSESYYPTPGYPNTEAGVESFAAANDAHGALVVNEAVTYNDDFNMHAGEYFDWVELRNLSGEAITLSDYYVTDNPDNPAKFQLPAVTLGPGELFLFYCGEPSSATSLVHTSFKLDSAGEGLYIYRADGSLSDYVSLYGIPLNHSKGRLEGQSGFFLFSSRTPGTANGYGTRAITPRPLSVTEPGIHNETASLDVELSGEGTIYYTLNGSEPTTSSEVYAGPIHLDATAQIRAIAVADGKLQSEIATYTYVINENHTLPVVCVTLDPKKLDILYNRNHNMEYDSHTEYYGPEGSFASDCMITLHGAASKSVWNKKSFKVVFKDRYGGDVNFDLFGQGITEFHSLNLRGGDSVGMHTFREPLAAEIADKVAVQDPFALDSRFCILYLNGSYWGIYTLREAYSQKYVADHTGSDEELTSISRAPIKLKYQPELFDLYNFIIGRDMSDPDNFNYVADRVDLESFAQWLLLETYFNNIDPFGNIRYCIGNQPDGRWRTMFFDLDKSMTNPDASIYEMIGKGHKPSQIGNMLNNLLKSPMFQQIYLETAAGLYRNGLCGDLVLQAFDRMTQEVEPEMDRNLKRWGESRALYDSTLAWQRTVFGARRDESWLKFVQAYSGADDETMARLFPPRG